MNDPFVAVAGQEDAVRQLRAAAKQPVHAYLFVGPAGSGKYVAALAFAAALLGDDRAARASHPDVITFERVGSAISVGQARDITKAAMRSPVEGSRKVLVLNEFHLVEEAAPALLKTIEEAPQSTVFVILADDVPSELTTVASRCVRIDFRRLSEGVVADILRSEGVGEADAETAAADAHGNVKRARLLVADDSAQHRRALWQAALGRLDGTGHAVASLTDEITRSMDDAATPLMERQQEERDDLERVNRDGGGGATVMKDLEAKHKRELRRLRTDELRAGFSTLARELGKRLAASDDTGSSRRLEEALAAVQWASETLTFNPNEGLLLNALFIRMSQQPSSATASR